MLDEITRLKMLEKPTGIVDAVLDTDAFNEVDDQFALSYMLRLTDKINTKAVFAAPFFNSRAESAKDGMEKSYEEIKKILALAGREDVPVYRGSDSFLKNENTPVISDAANALAELASEYTSEKPLYVVAIGAITNVASALLICPEIADKMVVIWLGGNAHFWPNTNEFNMNGDIAAARIVFGCGVPLVQFPCAGVVSAFTVSRPELEAWFSGKNKLTGYLAEITINEMGDKIANSRTIWDVTAVGYLAGDFELSEIVNTPIPQYDRHYSYDSSRHLMRRVYHIRRDRLLADLVEKLTK